MKSVIYTGGELEAMRLVGLSTNDPKEGRRAVERILALADQIRRERDELTRNGEV